MRWFKFEMILEVPPKPLCDSVAVCVLEELTTHRNPCWNREKGSIAAATGTAPLSLVVLELRSLLEIGRAHV